MPGYGSLQCHWFIHARPGHKILLYFDVFEVEGNPAERGCPAAALRVWPWRETDKTPIELCGDTLDGYKQILSETNVLKLSFYLADKAVGAKGFQATWTEIKVSGGRRGNKVRLIGLVSRMFPVATIPRNLSVGTLPTASPEN